MEAAAVVFCSILYFAVAFADLLREPGNKGLTIAISDALPALQIVHYAPELSDRIVFLADPALSRYLNKDTVHKAMIHLRGRFPPHIERLEDYLNRPQKFLVLNTPQNSFLEDHLSTTPGLRERVHRIT